ncbi:MAG: HEAT repeat domain-containing protein [SAR202 cluster bacterium]|jgi:HEAT repeat protein|nr:HEAT repeat domain-containing protein [SAR202 cluster bacterium]MDP6713735.1 HEAT repeat domain-containing protein [SAR202 cluster bacterium]
MKATDVAVSLAKRHGVDLKTIRGTGSRGIITAGDVLARKKPNEHTNRLNQTQKQIDAIEVNRLIAQLSSADDELRRRVTSSLGAIGSAAADKAIPALISALANPTEKSVVRESAANALGRFGPTATDKALFALIDALSDKNERVAFFAAHALHRFGRSAVHPLINDLSVSSHLASFQLAMDNEETATDQKLVKFRFSQAHRWHFRALRGIGEPAIPVLIKALSSSDEWCVIRSRQR